MTLLNLEDGEEHLFPLLNIGKLNLESTRFNYLIQRICMTHIFGGGGF